MLVALLASLTVPLASSAGEPPNQNDPCSRDGRDICGTTGVGYYETYRYGVRWFGDYRGSIPDEKHTFCIDLRYWYPSKAYPYRELDDATLRNRDGEEVRLANRQKLAYAIWTYGRSTNENRQAAVMLYVHALMGGARPGEVDPGGVQQSRRRRLVRPDREGRRALPRPVPDRDEPAEQSHARREGDGEDPRALCRGQRGAEPRAGALEPAATRRSRGASTTNSTVSPR